MNKVNQITNQFKKKYFTQGNIYVIIILLSLVIYNNYLPTLGILLSNSFSLLIITVLAIYNFKEKKHSTATSLIFLLMVSIFNKSKENKNDYNDTDLETTITDKSNLEFFKNKSDDTNDLNSNDDNNDLNSDDSEENNTEKCSSHNCKIDHQKDVDQISTDSNNSEATSNDSSDSEKVATISKKVNLYDTFKNLHDAIHNLETFVDGNN